MMRCQPRLQLVGVAAVLVVIGGCSDTTDTKAGGTEPVTLRLATVEPPDRPASDDVVEFARQVEELSDGMLRVEILWKAHETVVPADDPQPSRALVGMVKDGRAEMGLVPDGSWTEFGVTSFRALKAPFLVTSEALAGAVATSELAEEMLAGFVRRRHGGTRPAPGDLAASGGIRTGLSHVAGLRRVAAAHA